MHTDLVLSSDSESEAPRRPALPPTEHRNPVPNKQPRPPTTSTSTPQVIELADSEDEAESSTVAVELSQPEEKPAAMSWSNNDRTAPERATEPTSKQDAPDLVASPSAKAPPAARKSAPSGDLGGSNKSGARRSYRRPVGRDVTGFTGDLARKAAQSRAKRESRAGHKIDEMCVPFSFPTSFSRS
jgi:hypothetical protein